MRMVGTPQVSAAKRAAFKLRMCAWVGINTFPPKWPHFFSAASWSSKWTPVKRRLYLESYEQTECNTEWVTRKCNMKYNNICSIMDMIIPKVTEYIFVCEISVGINISLRIHWTEYIYTHISKDSVISQKQINELYKYVILLEIWYAILLVHCTTSVI